VTLFLGLRTYDDIPQRHGQTDRQTTCRSNTALCEASSRDKKNYRPEMILLDHESRYYTMYQLRIWTGW